VLVGPGPGDPRDRTDPRIGRLRETVRALLAARTPMLAVCLGHQVLAAELGLVVTRMDEPAQGVQRLVPLSGRLERVGFYHTFVAVSGTDERRCPVTGDPVRIDRDPVTGAVFALTKATVRSVQFHVESLLTEHGSALLREMLISVLRDRGDRQGSIDDFVKVRSRSIDGSNSPGR
jgi:phenazine biosynthesis protein phzE